MLKLKSATIGAGAFALMSALLIQSSWVSAKASSGFILTAQETIAGEPIRLDWEVPDEKDYTYRIYQQKPGEESYHPISATNYTDTKQVKVLNLYPYRGSMGTVETFETWDGETISGLSKAAALKQWMEMPNEEHEKGYGKGVIEVTPLKLSEFNENPTQYLTSTEGEWNYDVIMIGSWDANNRQDLSDEGLALVQSFLDAGYSILLGHDTVGYIEEMPNLRSLASYIMLEPSGGRKYNGVNTLNNTPPTGSESRITITKKGTLTSFPWEIGEIGDHLYVPGTHTLGQIANGDIWMKFNYEEFGMEANDNYYLTSWNNAAMIQTGHSQGAATSDEQKLLANALFYLNQISTDTYLEDNASQDFEAPNRPELVASAYNYEHVTFKLSATDNGSLYQYYVEASAKDGNSYYESNIVSAYAISGIAGYSYVIDDELETIPDDVIDQKSTNLRVNYEGQPGRYVHVKAIDSHGNASETLHFEIEDELKLSLEGDTIVNGDLRSTLISFTVPTELSFTINPNLEASEQFVSPIFKISNQTTAPLTLKVLTFEQLTTDEPFVDVLPSAHTDERWARLGAKESTQLALGLVTDESEAWLTLETGEIFASEVQTSEQAVTIGTIRSQATTFFNFKAKHGLAFKDSVEATYHVTFLFDLFD